MRHHSLSLGMFAAGLLAGATAAQAGIESWVSGTGTDAGTCPRTAPCRTFQFAHDQTNNNGAINVLTPGNFGQVTITKPISIVAEGVEAVINTAVTDDPAIKVLAGGGAVISLRGLTIDMRGTSNSGIDFSTGAVRVLIDSSAAVNNSTGISSQGNGSTIRLGRSIVTGNSTGIQAADSGVFESYGTNQVDGNIADVGGTLTPINPK